MSQGKTALGSCFTWKKFEKFENKPSRQIHVMSIASNVGWSYYSIFLSANGRFRYNRQRLQTQSVLKVYLSQSPNPRMSFAVPDNFASCFDNLGCFDTTEEWYDPVHRPVNLEPIERHIIRTEFILIKRSENYVILRPN